MLKDEKIYRAIQIALQKMIHRVSEDKNFWSCSMVLFIYIFSLMSKESVSREGQDRRSGGRKSDEQHRSWARESRRGRIECLRV